MNDIKYDLLACECTSSVRKWTTVVLIFAQGGGHTGPLHLGARSCRCLGVSSGTLIICRSGLDVCKNHDTVLLHPWSSFARVKPLSLGAGRAPLIMDPPLGVESASGTWLHTEIGS